MSAVGFPHLKNYFKVVSFSFYFVECLHHEKDSLYILHVFSQSVDCLFLSLWVSFAVQKLKSVVVTLVYFCICCL